MEPAQEHALTDHQPEGRAPVTTTSESLPTNVGYRHPELYTALTTVSALAERTAQAEGLSRLLIELVKIRTSQIDGCAFCLQVHTKGALAVGESPERISVLPAWRESLYFDEQERSALALTEYMTGIQDSRRIAGLYKSAVAHLTDGQLSAVTWLAMTINTYNRIAISSADTVKP